MKDFDEDKVEKTLARLERVRTHIEHLSTMFASAPSVKVKLGTHPYRSFYTYSSRTIAVSMGPHPTRCEKDTACHEFAHHLVNLNWSTTVSPHGLEFCQTLRNVAHRFYVGAPELYNWDGEYPSIKSWWIYSENRRIPQLEAAQPGRRIVAKLDYDSILRESGL